jgi:hypothetical protein
MLPYYNCGRPVYSFSGSRPHVNANQRAANYHDTNDRISSTGDWYCQQPPILDQADHEDERTEKKDHDRPASKNRKNWPTDREAQIHQHTRQKAQDEADLYDDIEFLGAVTCGR